MSRFGDWHPMQLKAWRGMTPNEKWALVRRANQLLREGVRNRLRRQNPGFTDEEIERATSRAILLRRT